MADCRDTFTLTRWVFKDLQKEEMEAVRIHVLSCETCRELARKIEKEATQVARENEDSFRTARNRYSCARARTSGDRRSGYLLPVGVAAAVALLGSVVGSLLYRENPSSSKIPAPSATGQDESLAMEAFVKRDGEQMSIKGGETLYTNDRMRFVLWSERPGFLSVFFTNGRGAVNPLYPSADPSADPAPYRIEKKGAVELPGAASLPESGEDAAIVALFSEEPFDRDTLHDRLAPLARARLHEELRRAVSKMKGKIKVFRLKRVKERASSAPRSFPDQR